MTPFVSRRWIRAELISVFAIRGAYCPSSPLPLIPFRKQYQGFLHCPPLFSPLSTIFPLVNPLACSSLLACVAVRHEFQCIHHLQYTVFNNVIVISERTTAIRVKKRRRKNPSRFLEVAAALLFMSFPLNSYSNVHSFYADHFCCTSTSSVTTCYILLHPLCWLAKVVRDVGGCVCVCGDALAKRWGGGLL